MNKSNFLNINFDRKGLRSNQKIEKEKEVDSKLKKASELYEEARNNVDMLAKDLENEELYETSRQNIKDLILSLGPTKRLFDNRIGLNSERYTQNQIIYLNKVRKPESLCQFFYNSFLHIVGRIKEKEE